MCCSWHPPHCSYIGQGALTRSGDSLRIFLTIASENRSPALVTSATTSSPGKAPLTKTTLRLK